MIPNRLGVILWVWDWLTWSARSQEDAWGSSQRLWHLHNNDVIKITYLKFAQGLKHRDFQWVGRVFHRLVADMVIKGKLCGQGSQMMLTWRGQHFKTRVWPSKAVPSLNNCGVKVPLSNTSIPWCRSSGAAHDPTGYTRCLQKGQLTQTTKKHISLLPSIGIHSCIQSWFHSSGFWRRLVFHISASTPSQRRRDSNVISWHLAATELLFLLLIQGSLSADVIGNHSYLKLLIGTSILWCFWWPLWTKAVLLPFFSGNLYGGRRLWPAQSWFWFFDASLFFAEAWCPCWILGR